MTLRDPANGSRRKRDLITPEGKRKVTQDHAERERITNKRQRGRTIRSMRVKHSAASHLRPFIDDVCSDLARSAAAYNQIADLLDEIAAELRSRARKAHDRIVREVDLIRPKLAEASRLARAEVAFEKIDKTVGLTKWIDEVDAEVTVREIFERIIVPKRHALKVEAYWLVGKIRDVSLAESSVKRIYNQTIERRRRG